MPNVDITAPVAPAPVTLIITRSVIALANPTPISGPRMSDRDTGTEVGEEPSIVVPSFAGDSTGIRISMVWGTPHAIPFSILGWKMQRPS
jgi:hypothetical protein